MRRLLGAAVVLLLATACAPDAASDGPDESRVAVDTPELRALKAEIGIRDCVPGTGEAGELPDITLACLGGGPSVDLTTLRGPMVINLWYAACPPCEKELPALVEFDEQHGEQVPLLGINSGVWPELELEKARQMGVRYPQLADPGSDLWGRRPFPALAGYPALGFIDEQGDMVGFEKGGIESSDELVDLVEKYLGIRL